MAFAHNDNKALRRPLLAVRRKTLASILLLALCAAIVETSSGSYLPGFGPRFVNSKVTYSDRGPKSDCFAAGKIALSVGRLALNADFRQTFVRLDRNRNRRLWPVIASGLTRSPPSSSSL